MATSRVFLVVLLLLSSALIVPTSAVATEPVRTRPVDLTSWDGTTLAGTLFWIPSTTEAPAPAILMTHGWAGSKADMVQEARWLAQLGYVVLAYDSRGFGASEGTVGLNGPDEWADVSAWVTWLARLKDAGGPTVLLDDAVADDPRIGMYGYSYGGAIQLLASAQDNRIDAVVPDITWSDLGHSLAPNGVVKRGWVDLLFWSGTFASSGAIQGQPSPMGMDERLRMWYLQSFQTGRLPDDAMEALAERSPVHHMDNISAHVLFTQGLQDTLFVPDEAATGFDLLSGRAGIEVHLLFHPAGHGHLLGSNELGHVRAEIERFYGRHLMDTDQEPVALAQWYDAQARRWWQTDEWPSAATGTVRAGATGDAGVVTLAQAPAPSSHTELQELEGTLGTSATDAPLPTSVRIPLDLEAPVVLMGAPVLHLDVTPEVDDLTLFVSLVDVGTESERVVGNQVTAWRIEGQSGNRVDLELPLITIAHTLQIGHHLEVRVATSDSGYLGGRESGTVSVDAGGAVLVVPAFDRSAAERDPAQEAEDRQRSPGAGVLLVGGLLALAGSMGMGRRRGRGPVPGR